MPKKHRLCAVQNSAGEEDAVTAEERFQRAREELRVGDAADRAAYRERCRERARLRKERARARAAAESAGDAAVRLTTPLETGSASGE
jgi:hypothetical protein